MSQDVLHFHCHACQAPLTVPVHLAGVTGPCPKCGATITSPQAPPAAAGLPPMPAMSAPQPPAYEPPAMSMPPMPAHTLPAGQLEQLLQPQQMPAENWGAPPMAAAPPQHMPPPMMQLPPSAPQAAAEPPRLDSPHPPTQLPPRRPPGQAPALGSSLLNQLGSGGLDPQTPGGTPSPQWTLPPASQPAPPMPQREVEDPMTTILQGVGPAPTADVGFDRRAPMANEPPQMPAAAPAMNIRLGGKPRAKGRLVAAIAAVLLIGALGTAGWFFQEPIRDLAARWFPADKSANKEKEPHADTTESKPAVATSSKTAPAAEEKTPEKVSPDFDPHAKDPEAKPEVKPADLSGLSGVNTPAMSKPAPTGGTLVPPGFSPSNPPAITINNPPAAEIKPGTPAEPLVMSAVPKATIVDDAADSKSKSSHVPGTALGKSVMPGDDPAAAVAGVVTSLAPGGVPSLEPTALDGAPEMKPEAAPAVKALRAFFSATNLEERLRHTLGAAAVKPLMERYYAKIDAGPITVDDIRFLRFDPKPATGGGAHCVFSVASKLWQYPIPVMLQNEGGAFKVDWLAFVEFRDNLLLQFLSDYQDVPARFHVGIRRTHYFDNDVPNLDAKDCFELQPPFPSYIGYVFVPKGTPLAADLAGRISWETVASFVIVELRWRKQGDMKWVELVGVPQLNWYSFQTAAQSGDAPADPAPPAAGSKKPSGGGVDIKKSKKSK